MSTIFPTWPHILFAVLEPISLIAGFAGVVFDLEYFLSGQTPTVPPPPTPFHPSTVAVAYQLGNIYLLLMFMGVGIMYSTSEPRVLRNYLIALAIADLGHIYATYVAMGWDAFVEVGSWGAVTWGNIGASAFLFANRVAYLLGVFGYAKAPKNEKTE